MNVFINTSFALILPAILDYGDPARNLSLIRSVKYVMGALIFGTFYMH